MINFKQREDALPSALILLAILSLLGTLVYMVLVPMPSAAGLAKGRELSRHKIEGEIEDAKQRADEMEKANRTRIWTGSPESVTATVLNLLTERAERKSLKLTAFRPQRPQTLEGLTELPFSVQISGPFPAVQDVIASLDTANSRLALRSVQIASADAASSAVTATLAFSAYMPGTASPANAPAKPATSTAGSTTGGAGRG